MPSWDVSTWMTRRNFKVHMFNTASTLSIPTSQLVAAPCSKCQIHSFFFFFNIYLFIYCWLCQVLVVARRLSCPAACGILVPRPGIEPTSPALEGGFLTTGPHQGSPCQIYSWLLYLTHIMQPLGSRVGSTFKIYHESKHFSLPSLLPL